MKIKFLLLLLALAPLTIQAQVNYAVDTVNNVAYVTNSTSASGNVAIASTYLGHPVTSIGQWAFDDDASLTGVTMPNSVTNIGMGAFYGCTSLTIATMGTGVTSIGEEAFYDCTKLTGVVIPNGVTDIGVGAFLQCLDLTSITIPNSVTSLGQAAFEDCSLTSVTIPDSVTSIGEFVFADNYGLTIITVAADNPDYSSVNNVLFDKNQTRLLQFPIGQAGNFGYTFPNSVITIDDEAFQNCFGLTNVVFDNSVTAIGDGEFADCFGLTSLTIPSSVTSISYQAFANCTHLTNITFLGNAPALSDGNEFNDDGVSGTVYYYSYASGWASTYGGLPTVELGGSGNVLSLVAQYSFDDGALAATDFSGNGNTLSNYYQYGGGRIGLTTNAVTPPDALALNSNGGLGGGYYYTTNTNLLSALAGSYSISLWLETPQSSGNNTDNGLLNAGIISGYTHNMGSNYVVPMAITGTKLAFATVGTNGTVNTLHSAANINLNQYIHVVETRDASTGAKQIYINGNLDSSGTGPTGMLNGTAWLQIGLGADTGFTGDLDDIQIYSGVLSSNEVLQMYDHPGTTATNGSHPPPPNNVIYAVSGNTAYVAYSPNAYGNAIISNSYEGLPVTSIDVGAFSACTNLTGVTIPGSVTNIGIFAFDSCTSLMNAVIGNGVVNISDEVFDRDTHLTSITIPDSATNIGFSAFFECTSLTNAVIGNGVVSIGEFAFDDCSILTSVVMGSSVRSIGDNAFADCLLSSVTIPNSVTNIGDDAFADNAGFTGGGLTNITVGAGNPDYSSINGVLFDKNQTMLIQFPVGLPGSYSYTIPSSVTNIVDSAFALGLGLTNIALSSNLTSIGEEAFLFCDRLTSVIIPGSVTNIGESAFDVCTSVTNITFLGNAPALADSTEFSDDFVSGPVYFYYGTSGWSSNYGGLPTFMLGAPSPQIGSSNGGGGGSTSVQSGQFSFNIAGVMNQTIIVEASTNLINWQPIWTNTLSGTNITFTDPQWTNYPNRYFRAR